MVYNVGNNERKGRIKMEEYECDGCCEVKEGEPERVVVTYGTPYYEEGDEFKFCSDECEEVHLERYFYCEGCERYIATDNGRRKFIRVVEHEHPHGSHNQVMCLVCYEEFLLENGQPVNDFDGASKINGGKFMDDRELEKEGWKRVGWYKIEGTEDIEQYNEDALHMKDLEVMVITNYESVAVGGIGGSVTMWVKPEFPEEWDEEWEEEVKLAHAELLSEEGGE